MGRTFDKSVLVGIGLVVALLVVNAGLAYRNTRQLLEDAGWVAHTHEVLDRTSDVLGTLGDAGAGRPGAASERQDPGQPPAAGPHRGTGEVDRQAAGPVEARDRPAPQRCR